MTNDQSVEMTCTCDRERGQACSECDATPDQARSHAAPERVADSRTLDMSETVFHVLTSHTRMGYDSKARVCDAIVEALDDYISDRERLRDIRWAVEECDRKAEKLGAADGFVKVYQLACGPWHRLLGVARRV